MDRLSTIICVFLFSLFALALSGCMVWGDIETIREKARGDKATNVECEVCGIEPCECEGTEAPVEYSIVLFVLNKESVDSVVAVPDRGIAGAVITLDYTVANIAENNFLYFDGVTIPIEPVSEADRGTREYTINANDAVNNGVIYIFANFLHTDLEPDPIEFAVYYGNKIVTYGEGGFTNVIKDHYNGSGAITYSSSVPGVATVNEFGQVTIGSAGITMIRAEKEADDIYAHSSKYYHLIVNPKKLTIKGFDIPKQYDDDNKIRFESLSFDGFAFDETAAVNADGVIAVYDNKSIGKEKTITIIDGDFTMTGGTADPKNYAIIQPTGITGEIIIASPSAPNAPGLESVTWNSVTLTAPQGANPLFALEYAKSEKDDAANLTWQDELVFPGLKPNTTYYFFARYKDSDKNEKSEASENLQVTTEHMIEMVKIPAGTFIMGQEGAGEATPLREVTLSAAFHMGKYEVTQEQYSAVMGTNPSAFKGQSLPVEQVSWYAAILFCNKLSIMEGLSPAYSINDEDLSSWEIPDGNENNSVWDTVQIVPDSTGYRLPTEAQWEYACRAGTTTEWFYGNNSNRDYMWFEDNSGGRTHEVGKKWPNPWGLYDMHGNVSEWCWDRYGAYQGGEQIDPPGPISGNFRLHRGGSWSHAADNARSAFRSVQINRSGPNSRASNLGFRVVRP